MEYQDDFVLLFPNEHQPKSEESFSSEKYREQSSQRSIQLNHHHLEDEQSEEIDEDILKKTSELHQALRNIKLLRFQLMQSKIMKKTNLTKCADLEQNIDKNRKRKMILQQQNEQLDRMIQLYKQKIIRQKDTNTHLNSRLDKVNNKLLKTKIQYKNMASNTNFSFMRQDKENISGIGNKTCIEVEKIGLEARNQSSQNSIQALKKQICLVKQKFKAKQARKKELQIEYQQLLQRLKQEQNSKSLIKDHFKSNHQENYCLEEIHEEYNKKEQYNRSICEVTQQNSSNQHSKNASNPQKNMKTENKDKKKAKNVTSTISTLKKHRIF